MKTLIKQLTLGSHTFANNIIQGPLAGYSCAPFRRITRLYGDPAFACTEMISSKALLYQPKKSLQRYVIKDPQEGPVCFQLSGNDPHILAQATKIVADYGADLIDLNCGCPVKKIRAKGLGSSLLTQPLTLFKLIQAMKQSTRVPVSIKIRVDGAGPEATHKELVKVIKDAGVDYLIVHGRHWTENYDIQCHYDQIKYFVEELPIPVIGNGDIACFDSLKTMFATGCAGVMISRAGVGQPWLIKELIARANNKPYQGLTLTQIGLIFLEHIEGLSSLFNNDKFTIVQARKLAKYYARGIEHKIDLINAVNHCGSLQDLSAIIKTHFM